MPSSLIYPAVVLILGLIAMLLFKPTIDKKIAGITKAGKDGVSFDHTQKGGEDQTALLPFIEIMRQAVSSSVLEREKTIEQQLHDLGLKTDAEKISVLSRVLANTRIELEFNNISYIIFGSQLSLLIEIVGTKNGVTKEQAEAIFAQAQKSFPDLHGSRKFDEWFLYLQSSNLVTYNEGEIDISQFGKDFLKHLVDSRMAHNRYG